jgi:hypothetical protein
MKNGESLFMPFLVARAYLKLISFEPNVAHGSFADLRHRISSIPVQHRPQNACTVPRICKAVDIACICFWKQVLCLQRSAVTLCLLKEEGVMATLVVGVQQVPFKAHAWIEVEGRVVNDKIYMSDIYQVLDRC